LANIVYKPLIEVLHQSEEKLLCNLTIPENLYYFQGHFEQAAILPGVTQIDWVMSYITEYFKVDTRNLVSIDQLKFQHIIRPNYVVEFSVDKLAANKYRFNYKSKHGQHSSGKVVLKVVLAE